MKKRILLVEDDAHLADGMIMNFELDGYEPVHAQSAEEGINYWKRGGIDLILLDVMLPGMDGFEFCKIIRDEGDKVPILFVTARGRDEDRIRGLEEGGDDYIIKPFNLRELLARIKGIFRREEWRREESAPSILIIGKARVDIVNLEAGTPDGTVILKEKEAMILRLLAEKNGEPVPRRTILDRIWGYDKYPSTRTVDNFILSLRKMIEEDPAHPKHIITVHGTGYKLIR
jgi:two-component system, OmpR family, alkaline phosphatase synthesis response regulator PhoP